MIKCQICKKEFIPRKKTQRFCSKECADKSFSIRYKGVSKNRHSWNYGLTAKSDKRVAKNAESISRSMVGKKQKLRHCSRKFVCPKCGKEVYTRAKGTHLLSHDVLVWGVINKKRSKALLGHPCYGLEGNRQKHYDLMKNTDYLQRIMRSNHVQPNKLEKQVDEFLQREFPKEWKFVGNGKVIIGGKCPDFMNINSKKLIIEVFGDYWHANPVLYKSSDKLRRWEGLLKAEDIWKEDKKRVRIFRRYGYNTLILWESDIKKDIDVKDKILEFLRKERSKRS